MKSKSLENLLARESGLRSDMVTRFQKLRDFGLLSKARGRNAEFLNTDEIVSGILSIVASKPGYAATTAIGLRNLKPVGAKEDAFAQADTLAAALTAALEDLTLLATVKKIYLGDSDPISIMATSAEIIYEYEKEERKTQYVPATALSLFQKGMEKKFDRHTLNKVVSQETIITPDLLARIVQEMKDVQEVTKQGSSHSVKYKIWCGLAQTESEFYSMKPNWMPRVRDSLHDALWDAMKINDAKLMAGDRQQIVWEIEGDDGSCINRQEIVELVRQRRQELVANPPKSY